MNRRKFVAAAIAATPATLLGAHHNEKPTQHLEWINLFDGKCIDDRVQIWVNGHKTTDVHDDPFQGGRVAIEHHGRGDTHYFRNIKIRQLPWRLLKAASAQSDFRRIFRQRTFSPIFSLLFPIP